MKETTLNKLDNFIPNRKGFLGIPNNIILLPISDFEFRLMSWICSHEEKHIPTITDFSKSFKKNKQDIFKNLLSLKEVIKLDIVKEIWGDTMPTLEEIERRIDLMIEKPLYKRKEKTLKKEKTEILEEETQKTELKIIENKEIIENPKEDIVFKNRREELLRWYNDPKGLINHRNIEGNRELLAKYCQDYLNFCMIQIKEPNFFELSQRIDRDTGGFKKNLDFKKTFRQIDKQEKEEENEIYKNFVRGL